MAVVAVAIVGLAYLTSLSLDLAIYLDVILLPIGARSVPQFISPS